MKKITNLSVVLFSLALFSSCAMTTPTNKPNIEFGKTVINAIYYKNQKVTLSNENSNLLINTISSQNWQKNQNIISKYKDKSEVIIDATREIKSDNDFYEKNEYDFDYLIDLDEGYVIMDLKVTSSSFHAVNTKLNESSLAKLRAMFNYSKPTEERTITIKYAEETNGVLKENEYTNQYTFSYNYPISHIITKIEYDKIYHDVNMSIPNNQGGYYIFDGFYSNLDKDKKYELKEGFVVDNNYTFYYTFTGGPATPPVPTGTFKLTIIDKNDVLINKPSLEYFTPGTKFVFKTHIVYDANVCMYVNDELYSRNGLNVGSSLKYRIESAPDYLEFEFIMPVDNVVIKFTIEGSSPVMSYEYLNNFYPFIDSLKGNTQKVKVEKGPIGVAPGCIKDITYTTDKTDIENLISVLYSPLKKIVTSEQVMEGGSYKEFTYYTNDNQTYSFRFDNDMININGNYYIFVNDTNMEIKNPDLTCNSFISYNEPLKIYYNKEYVTEINYLDKIEFRKFEGSIDMYYSGYLAKTSFGEFYIHSPKIFSYSPYYGDGVIYYEIVGEKDFFFLKF